MYIDSIYLGRYSSIGRTAVCGTVSFLFKSGYPPLCLKYVYLLYKCVFYFILSLQLYLFLSQDSSIG